MIVMKLGWLLLCGMFLGTFLYFGSSAALGMAIAMVFIPLCSLPLHYYVRFRLRSSLLLETNLRKGESGEFVVEITNPTIFPVLYARCRIDSRNQLNRMETSTWVHTWLPPKKTQCICLQTGSEYCGRLRLSVSQIVLYDCFGLIGVRCKSKASGHVTVQPDTFETSITLLPSLSTIEESDVYSQDKPGSDLTETFQIREYVPGDSPRQVHWKLSSKFDRLIVRDPAMPITRNVLVFWERTGESGLLDRIDAQAEVIVSLCKSLLDHSIQFTVGWNDTDRNLCVLHEIQNMDELIGIIPRLMRATGAPDGVSGVELLLQTGGHALCGHMVYLAEEVQSGIGEMERFGHVTPLLVGETGYAGAVMFDAQHYAEQLSQIEL